MKFHLSEQDIYGKPLQNSNLPNPIGIILLTGF
jgi:hypothetical protein